MKEKLEYTLSVLICANVAGANASLQHAQEEVKEAIKSLDSYIARLESEKLVMDIAKAIYTKRNGQWDYHLFRTQQEPYIKDAQAAINIIRGE